MTEVDAHNDIEVWMALVLLAIFIVHISVAEWSAESSTPSSCSDSEVTTNGYSEVTTTDDN